MAARPSTRTQLEAVLNIDGQARAAVDITLPVGWTSGEEIVEHVKDAVRELAQSLTSTQRKKTYKVVNGEEMIDLPPRKVEKVLDKAYSRPMLGDEALKDCWTFAKEGDRSLGRITLQLTSKKKCRGPKKPLENEEIGAVVVRFLPVNISNVWSNRAIARRTKFMEATGCNIMSYFCMEIWFSLHDVHINQLLLVRAG